VNALIAVGLVPIALAVRDPSSSMIVVACLFDFTVLPLLVTLGIQIAVKDVEVRGRLMNILCLVTMMMYLAPFFVMLFVLLLNAYLRLA
jgi:hypothetical protein